MFTTPVLSYKGRTSSFLPTVVEPHPSRPWVLSSPVLTLWSCRSCIHGNAPVVSPSVPPVLCTRFCFPSALSRGQAGAGQPRGAWILGNEGQCGLVTLHNTSSGVTIKCLVPPSPVSIFGFCPLHPSQTTIPLGSLGAGPSSCVPAGGQTLQGLRVL